MAYYKLATWVDRFACFQDGKVAFVTIAAAAQAARKSGRYRISEVSENGRHDFEPFTIDGPAAPAAKPSRRKGGLVSRPMMGRLH